MIVTFSGLDFTKLFVIKRDFSKRRTRHFRRDMLIACLRVNSRNVVQTFSPQFCNTVALFRSLMFCDLRVVLEVW